MDGRPGRPRLDRGARYRLALGGRTAVHPILVAFTDRRDQRKCWLAWRSTVDL
jgi:hypothetical protein